jgi:hypothetical protein
MKQNFWQVSSKSVRSDANTFRAVFDWRSVGCVMQHMLPFHSFDLGYRQIDEGKVRKPHVWDLVEMKNWLTFTTSLEQRTGVSI